MSAIGFDNNGQFNKLLIDVSCEQDEGWFLSLNITATGRNVVDLILSEPNEVEQFFRLVEAAKARWEASRE